MKPILRYLLILLVILIVFFAIYRVYNANSEIEGLTSIYDSVKNATDSQNALIQNLGNILSNNPKMYEAIKKLPDGGAGILAKTKAAMAASSNALVAAQNYK